MISLTQLRYLLIRAFLSALSLLGFKTDVLILSSFLLSSYSSEKKSNMKKIHVYNYGILYYWITFLTHTRSYLDSLSS